MSDERGHGARVPPPADEDFAMMDARVRIKLAQGEPLTSDERLFLARLPGDREVKPDELGRDQ